MVDSPAKYSVVTTILQCSTYDKSIILLDFYLLTENMFLITLPVSLKCICDVKYNLIWASRPIIMPFSFHFKQSLALVSSSLSWLPCPTADAAHRLNLVYLANDIIQNCKRKNAIVYRTAFAEMLPDAFLMVKWVDFSHCYNNRASAAVFSHLNC